MRKSTSTFIVAAVLAVTAGTIAIAQPAKQPASPTTDDAQAKMAAEMQACMMACAEASTVGPEHERLAKSVGTWKGQVTMYMPMPGMDAMKSECTTIITPRMDGRFFECDTKGDMGEMGPFEGAGISGFDNVSKQYTQVWYDCMGTGMAVGTGELSSDGSIMTWTLTYNCPVKKGPVQMRQIERVTGPDTMVLEVHGPNPLTGDDFKMMEISYKREKAQAAATTGR
jgi:hypothetical protein